MQFKTNSIHWPTLFSYQMLEHNSNDFDKNDVKIKQTYIIIITSLKL